MRVRPATVRIVLAWLVEDFKVVRERRTDLGERPDLEIIFVPRAVMWLNRGTAADLQKARAHASNVTDHKVSVFTYPMTERDPLGRAKADIVEADTVKFMKRGLEKTR